MLKATTRKIIALNKFEKRMFPHLRKKGTAVRKKLAQDIRRNKPVFKKYYQTGWGVD